MICISCKKLTDMGGGKRTLLLARSDLGEFFWTDGHAHRMEFTTRESAEAFLAEHRLPEPEEVATDPEVESLH